MGLVTMPPPGSGAQHASAATAGAGLDAIFDTAGGKTLDDSFAAVRTYTGHVASALGLGTHSLAPLSFRGATCSGVFTLLPLLTGDGPRTTARSRPRSPPS